MYSSVQGGTNVSPYVVTIDIRIYEPKDRHPLIFNAIDSLQAGERLLLINDHDPRPFYYQLMAERPNQYTWMDLEQGPEQWQAVIAKN